MEEAVDLPQDDSMTESPKTANNLRQNIQNPSQIFNTVTSVIRQRRKILGQTKCDLISNKHTHTHTQTAFSVVMAKASAAT